MSAGMPPQTFHAFDYNQCRTKVKNMLADCPFSIAIFVIVSMEAKMNSCLRA